MKGGAQHDWKQLLEYHERSEYDRLEELRKARKAIIDRQKNLLWMIKYI